MKSVSCGNPFYAMLQVAQPPGRYHRYQTGWFEGFASLLDLGVLLGWAACASPSNYVVEAGGHSLM